MSESDKIKNSAEGLKGDAKEKFGEATGDEQKQNEGAFESAKADLKQAGEKVKDAFK